MIYLKVNFDGSVRGKHGGDGFIIQGLDFTFVAARRHHLLKLLISKMELRAAWAEIVYVRRCSGAT